MRNDASTAEANDQSAVGWMLASGIVSWGIYALLTFLSRAFEYGSDPVHRPIPLLLGLLVAAFVIYAFAFRTATRAHDQRSIVSLVFVFATAFRLVLLFSSPIQEIDYYRYIWDGHVMTEGINPFRYSPHEILTTIPDHSTPEELRILVALRESRPPLSEIVARIHFGELSTVYPPASQWVFAAAAWTTPAGADLSTYVMIIKFWIVLFDLLALVLLIRILDLVGMPPGAAIVYGWCPLVLKEFANSGHLDSIAIFWTTAAVYLFVLGAKSVQGTIARHDVAAKRGKNVLFISLTAAAICFALAIGAKLYPLILTPLFAIGCLRIAGLRMAAWTAIVSLLGVALILWPMIGVNDSAETSDELSMPPPPPIVTDSSSDSDTESGLAVSTEPIVVADPFELLTEDLDRSSSGEGLSEFLSRWEMNDFIFLILRENLEPNDPLEAKQAAWFVIVPNSWRLTFDSSFSELVGADVGRSSFLMARVITGVLFVFLAVTLAVRCDYSEPTRILEYFFLTMAWFWLLLPTQNPWYWTWALAFVPFAKGRPWFYVSLIVLIYYLRFWLRYQFGDQPVWPTPYTGTTFFDFVVVWIEFLPWYVWLLVAYLRQEK